jgi:hypothetical protein
MKNLPSPITHPDLYVPVETVFYRGKTIEIYEDTIGHQILALWEGKWVELGYYNTVYQEDLKLLIDDELDTIYRFPTFPYGAKLSYFQNGGHRDVKLEFRGRLLKVFLLNETSEISEETLKTLAIDPLTSYLLQAGSK